MKKFLFVALMTFVMIGMSSCSKDKDLSGTSWKGHLNSRTTMTMYDETIVYAVDADVTLTFTSEEAGTTKTVGTVSMDDMTLPLNQTSGFSYTYDGKGEGTMTVKDQDSGADVTTRFTIDGNELTMYEGEETFVLKKQ
ncbi:MAG: hypothetical protein II661_01715 [Bacteroidales bacterium]|nr:hypothetical protein [Bacteroidales bacterium]